MMRGVFFLMAMRMVARLLVTFLLVGLVIILIRELSERGYLKARNA